MTNEWMNAYFINCSSGTDEGYEESVHHTDYFDQYHNKSHILFQAGWPRKVQSNDKRNGGLN